MTETLETQQAEMTMPEPQKEHAWLHRLIGEWEHTVEAPDMPASSPEACGGTESVRSIGGLWIVIEGTMPGPNGDPAASVMSLGYDPQKGRFVGTWFGSMMTHLWVYNGFLDESERVLTLESEGPSFTDPAKMSKYRDIIELVSDDHRTMTGNVLGEDGQWHRFMTAHYRRKA